MELLCVPSLSRDPHLCLFALVVHSEEGPYARPRAAALLEALVHRPRDQGSIASNEDSRCPPGDQTLPDEGASNTCDESLVS